MNTLAGEHEKLEFLGILLEEQIRLARVGWMYIGLYLIATAAPFTYLDCYAFDDDGLYGLFSFISWGFGYLLFVGLMQKGGYLAGGKQTGFGTYFALGIAIGVPVMLALVVLILPGLYLLMRWLPAYARALVTLDGVGNSMRWSWNETEPLQKQLSVAMAGPVLCYAASIGLLIAYELLYYHFDWTGYVVASIFWNSGVSLGVAWFTIFGIAAFGVINERNERHAEVFA